ncbi:MAG TPA: hypothetical protein VG938_05205 [Verrucomicrobiae bacterium]|jgi:hypothetical protein|nr:hypothetical protein [Verrucomicrobiae bacterium]
MPTRIKPRKESLSNGVYWVVSLGRKYTGGCRQRRYFDNRKEALAFVVQSEEARRKLGCEAFVLPMSLRAEAMACSQRHNAMRHSFGSYFLGKTKDENLTASEMGNSPEVIIKHYRALVREAAVANTGAFHPPLWRSDTT